MEITGRVTANAEVRTTTTGKKVVGFNLAINESYKTKSGEKRQETTFFECSYWRNEGIAMYLGKGALITITGMVAARVYQAKNEAKASLTFRVDNIKLLSKGEAIATTAPVVQTSEVANAGSAMKPSASFDTIPVPEDDLPF